MSEGALRAPYRKSSYQDTYSYAEVEEEKRRKVRKGTRGRNRRRVRSTKTRRVRRRRCRKEGVVDSKMKIKILGYLKRGVRPKIRKKAREWRRRKG